MSDSFDINKEPVELVVDLFHRGVQDQDQIFQRFERLDHLWRNYRDLSNKDPYHAFPQAPFAHANIEILASRYVKALLGRNPYIPLINHGGQFKDQVEIHEVALDRLNILSGFYVPAAQSVKQMLVKGTSFLEPMPIWDEVVVNEPIVSTNGDEPQLTDQEQVVRRFRLKYKAWAPESIIADPYATSLDDARWIIKVSTTSKRELKRLADLGAFGDEFNKSALDKAAPGLMGLGSKDQVRQLRESVGLAEPQTDDDVGVYLQLESRDKYIGVWDFQTLLYSKPNPHKHKKINLAQFINNIDTSAALQFWGFSVIKPHESLHLMYDMVLGIIIDNHNLANNRTYIYDKNKISPSDITFGGLIEVDRGFGESLQDALLPVPHVPLSNEFFAIPMMLERLLQIGYGVASQDVSQTTGSTATEAALIREQGDSRMEFGLKMAERGMETIAHLAMSHMNQYMDDDDWYDLLGPEKFTRFTHQNAQTIPGGCHCAFKASERFAQQVVKRKEMIDLTPLMTQMPSTRLPEWSKMILEVFGFTQEEIEKVTREEQEIQQIQQGEQQQASDTELQEHIRTRKASAAVGRENKAIEMLSGLRKIPNEEAQTTTQATAKRG